MRYWFCLMTIVLFVSAPAIALAQRGAPIGRTPGAPVITQPPLLKLPDLTIKPPIAAPLPPIRIEPTSPIHRPGPVIVVPPPPPCRGADCERQRRQREEAEKARRKYAECVDKSKDHRGRINSRKLTDCALGFMSPHRYARFRRCWQAANRNAWRCFHAAYGQG